MPICKPLMTAISKSRTVKILSEKFFNPAKILSQRLKCYCKNCKVFVFYLINLLIILPICSLRNPPKSEESHIWNINVALGLVACCDLFVKEILSVL